MSIPHARARHGWRSAAAALLLLAAAACQDRPTTAAPTVAEVAKASGDAGANAQDPVTVAVTASAWDSYTYFARPNDITLSFAGASATATLTPGVAQTVDFGWNAIITMGPYGVHPNPGEYHCASGFDETHVFNYTVTANGVSGTMAQPVRLRWICNDQGQMDLVATSVTLDLGNGQLLAIRQPATAGQFRACTSPSQSCPGGGGQMFRLQMEILVPRNAAPTARAGDDVHASLAIGSVDVALDGSGSSDPDGDALTYTWTGDFIGGSATGATPTVRFTTTGTHDVTLTVSDGTASTTDHVLVTVGDGSAPAISYAIDPASPNALGGWYTGSVTLTWTVSEPESPETLSKQGCVDQVISADQAKTSYSCAATSSGGTAPAVSVTIGRDATAPVIAGVVMPGAPNGANGWYVTAPVVSWNCSDATAGIASCSPATTLGESATAQQVTGSATDAAGNAASASVSGLLVDLHDPMVSCGTTPVFLVGAPGSVTASVSDDASGPVATSVSAAANTTSPGNRTVMLTGRDRAGRTTTVACAYSVRYQFDGFFQPVENDAVNTLKAGQALPIKWRLTGAGGAPVLDLAAAVVSVTDAHCAMGSTADLAQESAAGASGLQNLGGGYYQFNWKTPKSYGGSCKVVRVDVGDGVTHSFRVAFR